MSERILVVDDEQDAADGLVRLITAMGCEARAAYSGREAIGTLAAFRPDMILIDIGMPYMDGYALASRIRQAVRAEAILVAVTGWSRTEDKNRAYEAGFDLHVAKPMSAAKLQELLGLLDPVAHAHA
jgi:CheY-like chemotaxis protein